MNQGRFVSHAQNGEDVVLWRALQTIDEGTYVDVGANHPSVDSVSKSFYDRGWSGLLVEPSPHHAGLLRMERPRDHVIESVVADREGSVTLHMIEGTGLSSIIDSVGTAHQNEGKQVVDIEVPSERLSDLLDRRGLSGSPIHFMSIDTEGSEAAVLSGLDLGRHRPWVIVIEATAPTTTQQVHRGWEGLLLDAGYEFCLFDGLSRYYVAAEHSELLKESLSYPVCVFDDFDTMETVHRRNQLEQAIRELDQLAETARQLESRLRRSTREVELIRQTFSWRITAPLRLVRRAARKRNAVADDGRRGATG